MRNSSESTPSFLQFQFLTIRGFSRLAGTYIGRVLKGAIIVSSFCRLRRACCLSSTPLAFGEHRNFPIPGFNWGWRQAACLALSRSSCQFHGRSSSSL